MKHMTAFKEHEYNAFFPLFFCYSDCYEDRLLPKDYLMVLQITRVIVLLVIHNCSLTASVLLAEAHQLCLLMFNMH